MNVELGAVEGIPMDEFSNGTLMEFQCDGTKIFLYHEESVKFINSLPWESF